MIFFAGNSRILDSRVEGHFGDFEEQREKNASTPNGFGAARLVATRVESSNSSDVQRGRCDVRRFVRLLRNDGLGAAL